MNKYQISIPKPCTEDWDKMTKTAQGKHCASCNKVVIDFSTMNNQQIIEILLAQKGKKICGNFYNTQIKNPIQYIAPVRHMKWPAIAAMLVAGLFHLAPGGAYAQRAHEKVVHPTTIKTERNLTDSKTNTEPGKDSLVTYTIKIKSVETKLAIGGAQVIIKD